MGIDLKESHRLRSVRSVNNMGEIWGCGRKIEKPGYVSGNI